MSYEFPQDMSLEEVRSVIARANERLGTKVFIEADRGDHVIFNYLLSFPETFPSPTTGDEALDREYAILRECRGITFSPSGRLLNRKFHKFFNIGEKDETFHKNIDFSRPHKVLQKLDGSLFTPIFLGDIENINPEEIVWASKMGPTTDICSQVNEWVSKHPHYASWAAQTLYAGYTPMFEWLSLKQKIVLSYPVDRLVLTAIRNNITGEYLPYSALEAAGRSEIDYVTALDGSVENIELFMTEAHDLKGEEGYVIVFDDGARYKLKGAEYCLIHRTKDSLRLDKDVIALILGDNVDDIKSFMDEGDRKRIDDFTTAFEHEVYRTSIRLAYLVVGGYRATGGDKKNFAINFVKSQTWAPMESGILFSLFDIIQKNENYSNGSLFDATNLLVRDIIKKNTSSGTKTQGVSHLFGGLSWERDFRDPTTVFVED